MESDGENTLVINDLLSFVSCKLTLFPRKKLTLVIKEFYPKEEIIQAHNTLLECLPKSFCNKYKNSDSLQGIISLVSNLSEETSPIFVCQNINNVPQMKPGTLAKSQVIFPGMNLSTQEQRELQEEHTNLKSQISEVSMVVRQLKDQMEILINKYKSYDSDDSTSKKKSTKKQKSKSLTKKAEPNKTPQKVKTTKKTEEAEELLEEEITGALIDTTRIRAQRKIPQGLGDTSEDTSSECASPKFKRVRKRKCETVTMPVSDELEALRVTSSSDPLSTQSESEDLEASVESEEVDAKGMVVKKCFIALGRCDTDETEQNNSVIKKESTTTDEDAEPSRQSSRRPHRTKFSTFSDDFVVDFGSRSTKKLKK